MNTSHVRLRAAVLPLFAALALPVATHAAVLSDPTLYTGADAIDPAGSEGIDVSHGNITESALEALPGFRAVQDFTGFTGATANNASVTNYISFTDSAQPDIRFTTTGATAINNSGAHGTSPAQGTSGTSLIILDASTVAAMTMTITFGSYDAGVFTSAIGVSAAGFTLSNNADAYAFSIVFRSTLGAALQTVSFNGDTDADAGGNHLDVFVGYQADSGSLIGSVEITRTGSSFNTGFDDLGFSTIPEPSTYAALLGLAGLSFAAYRRHTRGH